MVRECGTSGVMKSAICGTFFVKVYHSDLVFCGLTWRGKMQALMGFKGLGRMKSEIWGG